MQKLLLIFIFLLICLNFTQSHAQRFVEDQMGILSPEQIEELSQSIKDFEKETSIEIAIRIVDSLDLSEKHIRTYAHEIFEELGIGKKAFDNGILILHSPKNRKIDIELGYGIEPYLSDLKAKEIIDEKMAPYFKEDDFYGGFKKALSYIKIYLDDAIFIDPQRDDFLVDKAKLLQEEEKTQLSTKLKAFFDSTGHIIWVRVLEDEDALNQSREVARSLHRGLLDNEDQRCQILYYLGVSRNDDGDVFLYPRIEVNFSWRDWVKDISREGDHYDSKWRVFGDDSYDLITYRLESKATFDLYNNGEYYKGMDNVVNLIFKIYNKKIKKSTEIKEPFTTMGFLFSPLGFVLMIMLAPILIIVIGVLLVNKFGGGGGSGGSWIGGSSSYNSSSSGSSGGWFGGGGSSSSSGGYDSGGGFGGGSSGGGGASGDY